MPGADHPGARLRSGAPLPRGPLSAILASPPGSCAAVQLEIRDRLSRRLDPRTADALDSLLRRARSASRLRPHRAAVRGSGRSPGTVDESETGSANLFTCRRTPIVQPEHRLDARGVSDELRAQRRFRSRQLARGPLGVYEAVISGHRESVPVRGFRSTKRLGVTGGDWSRHVSLTRNEGVPGSSPGVGLKVPAQKPLVFSIWE